MLKARSFQVGYLALPLAFLAIYAAWSTVLPITQAPDEYMRIMIPDFIYGNGCLPNGFDESIRNPIWGISYGFTPYGPSIIAAFFMWVVSFFSNDAGAFVVAARFVSALAGAGVVFLCELIGRELFDNDWTPYLLGVLVGALPQFVFCSSYFNSDASVIFGTALVIYGWLYGVRTHWRIGSCVILGIGIGICVMSYYFSYGFIIASLIVYFGSWKKILHDDKAGRLSTCIGHALIVFIVAFALAGWFFIRNAIIYSGDFMGMVSSTTSGEMYAQDAYKPSTHLNPRTEGVNPIEMILTPYHGALWWTSVLKSSIGVFGYLNVFIPSIFYMIYCALFIVGIIGSFFYLKRGKRIGSKALVFTCLLLCIVSVVAFSVYYSWSNDYQAQGRYLGSALVGVMIFIAAGYEAISKKLYVAPAKVNGLKQGAHTKLIGVSGEKAIQPLTFIVPAIAIMYLLIFAYILMTVIMPLCTAGIFAS